jgi:hypothetical protein
LGRVLSAQSDREFRTLYLVPFVIDAAVPAVVGQLSLQFLKADYMMATCSIGPVSLNLRVQRNRKVEELIALEIIIELHIYRYTLSYNSH